MESDGPASPAGSTTPTHDEPASPDIVEQVIGSPTPTHDEPASPDIVEQVIGSPSRSITPTHDEPASPDEAEQPIGSPSGSDTPTHDEPASPDAPEQVIGSPTKSITPTHDEPASPDIVEEVIASPSGSATNDEPDIPDVEKQSIQSPSGSITPTHDEPASPDAVEQAITSPSGSATPTHGETALPTDNDIAPVAMDIDNDAQEEGPASPLAEDNVIEEPHSPTRDDADKSEAIEPASKDTPSSPLPDTAESPEPDEKMKEMSMSPSSPSQENDDDGSKSDKEDGSGSDDDKPTTSKSKRIASDSDSEEESAPSGGKRRLESSDSEGEEVTPTKRKKRIDSNDSENEEDKGGEKASRSDGEESDKGEGDGDVIADIFGDSSDEEGDFQGFDEAEIKSATAAETALPEVSSDDELEDDQRQKDSFVSDFDEMIARKKEERANSRRRKRNVDIINDNDDLIVDMLKRMREAAEEDRTLNMNHQPATRKLTMLPTIIRQLNKSELQTAFMDCGVLSALTEWLAPLPDKSLPHLSIRQTLLKLLVTLPHPDTDHLKSSGIGKAIMYLFKHPKEMRSNRDIAGRLINEWSRPIFGQSSNFKSVNREDMQRRDMETLKTRRKSSEGAPKEEEEQKALRPGDPGWIYRARVPRPSNRDYVIRPESNVDPETNFSKGSTKKRKTRYEVQKQKMDNKKKSMKSLTAVKISIEGKNMAL